MALAPKLQGGTAELSGMDFDFDAGIQCLAHMAGGALKEQSGRPFVLSFQRLPSLLETWGKLHRKLTCLDVEYRGFILLYEKQSQLAEDLNQLTSLPPANVAVLNPQALATSDSSAWCQRLVAETDGQVAPRLDGVADGVNECPSPLTVGCHRVVFWQDEHWFSGKSGKPKPAVQKWMNDQLTAGSKEQPTVVLVCAVPNEMDILEQRPPTKHVDCVLLDASVCSAERVKTRSGAAKRAKGPAGTNGDVLEKVNSKCELRFSGMWTLPTFHPPPAGAAFGSATAARAPRAPALPRPESAKTKAEKKEKEDRAKSIDRGNRSRRWFPPPGPDMASMTQPTFFDNVYSSFADFDGEPLEGEKYDAWRGKCGDLLVEAMGRVQCRPVPPAPIKEVVEKMREEGVQKDFVRCMFRYATGYLSGSEGAERDVKYEDALNRVCKCLRWQRQRWGDLLEPALRGTDFLQWSGTGEDDMSALKAAVPFDIMRHELYDSSHKLVRYRSGNSGLL